MRLTFICLWCCITGFSADLTTSVLVSTNHTTSSLILAVAPVPLTCDSVNDSNLKAYWKLDESSGNAIDAKGANTLTDNNLVGTNSGIINGARLFSSALGNYFSIPDNANLGGCSCNMEIWAWSFATGAGSAPSIVSKLPSAGNYEYVLYLDNSGPNFVFRVSSDGTALDTVTSSTNVSPGWHFSDVWYDDTAHTINIQVDGGVIDSASHTGGIFRGTGDFYLGRDQAGGNNMNGAIDEVGFYKGNLTTTQRARLFNQGHACRPGGL